MRKLPCYYPSGYSALRYRHTCHNTHGIEIINMQGLLKRYNRVIITLK